MFSRLHVREDYSGTGIGLAIVQQVAERSDGAAWVEESHLGGSRFCITLPARTRLRSPAGDDRHSAEALMQDPPRRGQPRRRRADPGRAPGRQGGQRGDGGPGRRGRARAPARAGDRQPDLVILDLNLPRALRARGPGGHAGRRVAAPDPGRRPHHLRGRVRRGEDLRPGRQLLPDQARRHRPVRPRGAVHRRLLARPGQAAASEHASPIRPATPWCWTATAG